MKAPNRLLFLLPGLLACSLAAAQFGASVSGTANLNIPPSGTGASAGGCATGSPNNTEYSLAVTAAFVVTNVHLVLNLNHSYVGDLTLKLRHCGTTVVLYDRSHRVTGVVAAGHHYGPAREAGTSAFLPMSAVPFLPFEGAHMAVVVAPGIGPNVPDLLRAAVWRAEPTVPVPTVRAMATWAEIATAETRFDSTLLTVFGALALFAAATLASPLAVRGATTINGRVTGAGAPISGSTVTLWAAGTAAPKQLAQGQTGNDGGFSLSAADAGSDGAEER